MFESDVKARLDFFPLSFHLVSYRGLTVFMNEERVGRGRNSSAHFVNFYSLHAPQRFLHNSSFFFHGFYEKRRQTINALGKFNAMYFLLLITQECIEHNNIQGIN